MIKISLKYIRLYFLLSYICIGSLNGQILGDTATLGKVKKCVDYIYNCRFSDANELFSQINSLHPGNPIIRLLSGMKTYWEQYPLIATSPTRKSYEDDLKSVIEMSEKKHKPNEEAEYLLMDLCARGMLLLFYSDNDLSREVFPLATDTYQCIRRAFDYPAVYPDFYFFTGLYNYYREAYPDAHPIYKALAFVFPKGDKVKGLQELQKAAKYSIVLKAESSSFLSNICISFENDYVQASVYSKSLYELYPANPQYLADYIKNLLLEKQYDEAEKLITSSGNKNSNSYCRAQLLILTGIIQEKKYHNNESAIHYYNDGIKEISVFGDYGNDYVAYAYFGLSRLVEGESDKPKRKTYRKKALDLASYKKINFDN